MRLMVLPLFLLLLCSSAYAVSAGETYVFTGKWGTYGSGAGFLDYPSDIAIDHFGNVYVIDKGGYQDRIQKFDANGGFIKAIGSGDLTSPRGIAIDGDNNLHVLDDDPVSPRIAKFDPDGAFVSEIELETDEDTGDWTILHGYEGIAVDGQGNSYVTDSPNRSVWKLDPQGHVLAKWGEEGSADGDFTSPWHITVDGVGNVYVVDAGANRIQKFDANGNFLAKWGTEGIGWGSPYPGPQFVGPTDIAVDTAGDFYVADSGNYRVQKFDANGTFITKFGSRGSGDGQFGQEGEFAPTDIEIDGGGQLYVVDKAQHRIQKFVRVETTPTPVTDGPAIEWQRMLGGHKTVSEWSEEYYASRQTSDGGSILLGSVNDRGVGGDEIWVAKLTGAGALQWEKRLGGGSGEARGYSVQQTADGGYILLGSTNSGADGNITDPNHGAYGTSDMWAVKLDGGGVIQWQQRLGGTGNEVGRSVQQTADSGFILLGYSSSTGSGDVVGTSHGGYDYWVVKLDAGGNVLWEKLLGGSEADRGYSIGLTADGGYVLLGHSYSSEDGDVTGKRHEEFEYSRPEADYWVVKLDAGGQKQWDRLLGGFEYDSGYSVQQTVDGGYILLGASTSSASGNVTGTIHGEPDVYGDYPPDCWMLKLDRTGAIQWQKLLGGGGYDCGYSVQQVTDGGYVLLAESHSSSSGDITGTNHGISDFWVVNLDAAGAIQWQRLIGGTGYDAGRSVQQTTDGGYVLFGYSWTSDASGDIGGTEGQHWVVKLKAESAEPAPTVKQMPGAAGAPTDPDADGKYDDVNGNHRKDFADVVLYFNQMTWIAANEPVGLFDFNGNSRIDFADVVWLFNHL